MFPANFDYHRATDIDEAIRLLSTLPEAKLLAGGHSLIPMMKLRLAAPETLVDIGRIAELRGIEGGEAGVRIGALTTHTELAGSAVLTRHAPLLAEAAAKIADPAVRNKGTLGGNIAHADPASDLPAVLVALGATVHLASGEGKRSVAASAFFTGLLETALQDGEILVAVEIPAGAAGQGSCYLKVEHPASGYAICGAAAVVGIDRDGRCTGARVAMGGVSATPLEISGLGDALTGGGLSDGDIDRAVDELGQKIWVTVDPLGDIHASGEYRKALSQVYGKRALKLARDRAKA